MFPFSVLSVLPRYDITLLMMVAIQPAFGETQILLLEDFSTDPIAGEVAMAVNDTVPSRFAHAPGNLTASYHSGQQSTRLEFPLGRTITDQDGFKFSTTFTILEEDYFADDSGGLAQITFGLFNSSTTGLDRTGSPANFSSNTFDLITLDYFPGDHPFFDSISLTPTVFESQFPDSGDAFAGVSFPAAKESVISDVGEVAESSRRLPLDTQMTAELTYDAQTRWITVTLATPAGPEVLNSVGQDDLPGGPDGDIFTIQHRMPRAGDPVLFFGASGEDPRDPDGDGFRNEDPVFAVDSFGLIMFEDGFDTLFSANGANSVIADVQFNHIEVAVPEPCSLVLWTCAGGVWLTLRPSVARRGRSRKT